MAKTQSLLLQCAQKKPAALKQLYERYASELYALACTLSADSHLAQQLLKHSFVLIWHHANSYEPARSSARAWIYSIFRYTAQQHLKTPVPDTRPTPTTTFVITPTASEGLSPYKHLSPTARRMVGLAYAYGYGYNQLAHALQLTPYACKAQLHEALVLLSHLYPGWQSSSDEQLLLLGEYCLALLDTTQQAQATQLLQTEATAAQDLLLWEHCFSYLSACLAQPVLPSLLWQQLTTELGLEYTQQTQKSSPTTPPIATPPSSPPQVTTATTATRSATTAQATPASTITPPQKAHTTPPSTPATADSTAVTATPASASKGGRYLWLSGALILAILTAVTLWAWAPKAPIVHQIQMSPRLGAVLLAPGQSLTPGWVLSVDPQGHVLLTPQVHTQLKSGQAVQLWTQAPNERHVRSLGLINPNEPVTLLAELIGEVHDQQLFEMTIESEQGSSSPTGEVLFIGRMVRFGDYDEAPTPAKI